MGALIALLAVAGFASATNPDPVKMVLRLSDVPRGFHTASSGYKSTAAVAKGSTVSLSQYKAWGYVIGYEADFGQGGSTSDLFSGAAEIASSAAIYRTDAGAEASLTSSAKDCAIAPSHELTVKTRIGNETHLCEVASKSGDKTAEIYGVLWRHGRVRAFVGLAGIKGRVSATEAISLAIRQDQRIR